MPTPPILRSLLWKEWREHRWKALGIFLTCLAFLCACRFGLTRDRLEVFQSAISFLALLIPLFLAMETITEERANKTYETSLNLPINPPVVFYHRCLWDLAIAIFPMLLVQLLALNVLYDARTLSLTGPIKVLSWFVLPAASACSFYAWILLFCVRFRSQVKVAIAALFILFAHYLLYQMFDFTLRFWQHGAAVSRDYAAYTLFRDQSVAFFNALSPLNSAIDGAVLSPINVLGSCCFSLLLLLAASQRYSRTAARRTPWQFRLSRSLTLRPRLFPIFWKTWHESRLLVCFYLLAAIMVIACYVYTFFNPTEYPRYALPAVLLGVRVFYGIPALLSLGAIFVALIIGGNIGATDLEHRLDLFWQSRPIHPARYFYKRYASGLAITLFAFLLPTLLFAVIAPVLLYLYPDSDILHLSVLRTRVEPRLLQNYFWYRILEIPRQVEAEAFYALPEICLTYGIAAFSAAFLRQRLLAMLLAGLLFFILPLGTLVANACNGLTTLDSSHYYVYNMTLSDHLNTFVLLALLLLLPLSLLLARLASSSFLFDWKSHLEQLLSRLRTAKNPTPLPTGN